MKTTETSSDDEHEEDVVTLSMFETLCKVHGSLLMNSGLRHLVMCKILLYRRLPPRDKKWDKGATVQHVYLGLPLPK